MKSRLKIPIIKPLLEYANGNQIKIINNNVANILRPAGWKRHFQIPTWEKVDIFTKDNIVYANIEDWHIW